jgi:AraC-like DNA-binding protein
MAFSSFLHEVGLPVDRLLRRQGLPVCCEDPDAFVPLARVWSFFDAAARLDVPMVGWHVGGHIGDHGLGGRLLNQLNSAPTLLQAMHRLIRLAGAEASHVNLGVLERRNDVLLYTLYPGRREEPGHMQSQFYQLQIFLAVIRHFLGRHWVPDELGTEHSVVPAVVQAQLPDCRIHTRQPLGYVTVPRAHLHKAAPRVESEADSAGTPALTKNFDYADVLRELLRPYLSEGYPTERFAAALMDTSVRTLIRRISACGLTYRALVDEVRFTAAKELLQQPDVRLSEVSLSIGFEDQSHFTRMFRRVGGLTPGQMRKATRGMQE